MRNLQSVGLLMTSGLSTKPDPTKVGHQGFHRLDNADGYEEFGSWSKVPGSTRKSNKFPGGVTWLKQYEFIDLAGARNLQRCALSDGKIYRLEDSGALTLLKSGLVDEYLSSEVTLDKLFMCSKGNSPLKYDGTTVTKWGVWAPGSEETVVESFDDHTDFSVSGGTKADSAVSKDGTGSVQVNKTSTATTTVSLTRSGVAWDLDSAGSRQLFIFVMLPAGIMPMLDIESYAVAIDISDGTNTNSFRFSVGALVEGWNYFALPMDAPDVDGGCNYAAVTSLVCKVVFSHAEFVCNGILWDKFYITGEGAPVTMDAGTGSIQGSVTYRVTYISKYGIESNAGPPSAAAGSGSVGRTYAVAGIAISSDSQVVARRIYRDLNGDANWRFVTQIDDNYTTSYVDNSTTSSLSTLTPPLAGDVLKDNSPPPRMSQVVAWKNHLIGIDAEVIRKLQLCDE